MEIEKEYNKTLPINEIKEMQATLKQYETIFDKFKNNSNMYSLFQQIQNLSSRKSDDSSSN
jgi:hypothetical protein